MWKNGFKLNSCRF